MKATIEKKWNNNQIDTEHNNKKIRIQTPKNIQRSTYFYNRKAKSASNRKYIKLKKNKTQFLFLNGRIRINMKHYKQQKKKMESIPILFINKYRTTTYRYFYSIPIGIKIKLKKNWELIWNTTNYNQSLNT